MILNRPSLVNSLNIRSSVRAIVFHCVGLLLLIGSDWCSLRCCPVATGQ